MGIFERLIQRPRFGQAGTHAETPQSNTRESIQIIAAVQPPVKMVYGQQPITPPQTGLLGMAMRKWIR